MVKLPDVQGLCEVSGEVRGSLEDYLLRLYLYISSTNVETKMYWYR